MLKHCFSSYSCLKEKRTKLKERLFPGILPGESFYSSKINFFSKKFPNIFSENRNLFSKFSGISLPGNGIFLIKNSRVENKFFLKKIFRELFLNYLGISLPGTRINFFPETFLGNLFSKFSGISLPGNGIFLIKNSRDSRN